MLRSAISAFTRVFDALCLAAWCAADPGSIRRGSLGPGCAVHRRRDAAPRPGHDGALLSQPFRRALFRKRLWSLDVILRRRHRLDSGIFALLGHRLIQRDRETLLDGL